MSGARKQAAALHPDANRCALAHHLWRASRLEPSRRLTRGCTPALGGLDTNSRAARAALHWAVLDEHGVQPRVGRAGGAMHAARDKSDARAQRFASGRNDSGCFRAPLIAAPRWCAVQRLFFGDFLLAPQKKVTAPPGAHPGTTLANNLKYRALDE
jgi:hypothetical protein